MRYTRGGRIHTRKGMVLMAAEDNKPNGWSRTEVATLGGGCFWCLEAVYEDLRGVEKVESGYSGGPVPNPTYRQVCTGTTGHAEVVQVRFDPEVVSYKEILEVFFTIHDPTTLNRQGADAGPQYRSAIFYHDEEQRHVAEEVISELEAKGVWDNPIVTEVTPFEAFYVAEDYHQGYYRNNAYQPYCQVVIAPKVAKFRKQYLEKLKA
jgi:peptide-methionine (S)-S-oxide reductase